MKEETSALPSTMTAEQALRHARLVEAAEHGDGDAWGQNNLGACYEHGLGCVQSYPNAVKWYRRAVAQGNATAHMNLGYCYLRGHGVARDSVEALRLFRLAVEGGEDRAQREIERLEA